MTQPLYPEAFASIIRRYMTNAKRFKPYILTVLAILSFSTFLPALAYAAPLATSAKDWQFVNGNSWAWNYSPETQINKNNVGNLEVKWIFPLEGKASALAGMQAVFAGTGSEGSTTPPIVRDGKVFVTTNYLRTYAVDASNGKLVWKYDYNIDLNEVQKRLPVASSLRKHLHGFRYWEAGDAILLNGLACDIYAIDAKTGKEKVWVKDLCLNIPGNLYNYYQYAGFTATSSQAAIGTYEKGRQFVVVMPGAMHSTIFSGDSRHVTVGVSMDTKQIQWRIFSYPPQDVATKDWALQECDVGFFQTFPCKDVAAKNQAGLEWDWAFPNQKPSIYGGVTANWGQTVVDEDTGIMYTNTGNQGPYTNVSMTPGPRLYGSTIMAIDMNKGKRVWWLQPFPHDLYDYDCNWSGILAEVTGLGKVYMKGCKEGMLYVMDAATGKPKYVVDVVKEQVAWGQIGAAASTEIPKGVKYHLNDPFSYSDMRELRGITDGKYCKAPCDVYPAWSNGVFATDMSYDPETQTLFHYAKGQQTKVLAENPYVEGKSVTSTQGFPKLNTTIVARDAATGKVKWTWFWPVDAQRSHMVVTPDLVLTGFTDGYMRFFDKSSGKLLYEMNIGSDDHVGVTTGQDSAGKQKLFTILGAGPSATSIAPTTTGTLVAVGLSDRAAAAAQTTTVTTTATTATTVVSTQPATTVTSQVTETVGLPAEVTYAAVAVAVIAMIAAAVLTMRKKA